MSHPSRRKFIRDLSFTATLLLGGKISWLSAAETRAMQQDTLLRFAVASDAHYGQPDTKYEALFDTMSHQINTFHRSHPLDFCVLNGDLIHNEKTFLQQVRKKADQLAVPYYVTRGNHDMVTPEHWKDVWGTPLNHDVAIGSDHALILGDTSNEKGEYLSVDLDWIEKKFEAHKNRKNVFVFLHIPQSKWTKNAVDTPAFMQLVQKYPNIKAVFHGHEHDQDGVYMSGAIPFLFDSHIGGNWGTDYKGFRVVELNKDGSLLTYIMNPSEKKNEMKY